MKLIKSLLLGSAAGLTAVAGAQAADLPVKKAAPIEYVRVCGAYGAGFFYIPGTDTCLRVSGRARGEAGINTSPNRRSSGDISQFRGLLRINVDARTQTDFGTLRAFARLEAASATGEGKMASGTQARIGNAFFGTGQDAYNRVQDYVQAEKAFIQFAGLTAGRASSFFDFYAHDFEIIGSSLGSDQASTNIFAYTKTFGEGFSATVSMEDPNFRKNPIYSNGGALPGSINANANTIGQTFLGIGTNAPSPVVLNFGPTGAVANVGYVDVVQRSRMPDFVGALRYDQPWGSLQISGAVKDVNTGGFLGTITTNPGQAAVTATGAAAALAARGITSGAQTDYGWAVQGGAKFNLPFIAPGDSLYLQGAYGEGAANYTGYTSYIGRYTQATGIVSGGPWNVYMNDAVINPVTGKLELSTSWTVVASYLHYWTPQWRSAVYGSYGEMHQPSGAVSALRGLAGGTGIGGLPTANPAAANATSTLVSTSQVVTGASLIWSPVKDLDIGAEGQYIRVDTLNGQRVLNTDTNRLVSGQDVFQARVRVQRDF